MEKLILPTENSGEPVDIDRIIERALDRFCDTLEQCHHNCSNCALSDLNSIIKYKKQTKENPCN